MTALETAASVFANCSDRLARIACQQLKIVAKTSAARKVAVAHPFEQSHGRYGEYLAHYGFQMVGVRGADKKVGDLALTSSEVSLDLARTLHRSYADADTLYFPAPHWGIATAIQPIERELGVNVVTALQAIVWESLRRCRIEDRIEGYGRLLKDH